ncbi:hypothetical protein [Nocardioides euryhalodurans]|uniref:Uncharacterized protein n=1 Tax=Nocardioides euryhalodurans TaxID=2518370 RepID=A0A4P7GK31_9ACTN|nr:hypothetical protein [Nocardioides euryhalodurans]QBR92127.1 hypothetical protein EXE57_07415 [Nocardioides euryhalodurans]
MYLSRRQAAQLLDQRLGIARRAAERLLAAGLAGEPVVTSSAALYEAERVEALAQRPEVDQDDLPPGCRGGVLVARTTETTDPLGAVHGPARFSMITRAATRLARPEGQGWFPLVVLIHHAVVAGAELLDIVPAPRDHPQVAAAERWPGRPPLWMLETRPPGDWFADHFDGRVLRQPPGNPYLLWACPLMKPPEAIC